MSLELLLKILQMEENRMAKDSAHWTVHTHVHTPPIQPRGHRLVTLPLTEGHLSSSCCFPSKPGFIFPMTWGSW